MSERWTARLGAAVSVALTAAYVLLLTHPHYDLNDDVLLMRAFGGMVGGVAEGFSTCIHPLLSWLLQRGTLLWPQVAWFSAVQAGLLAGSVWAIVHSAIMCARHMGRSGWGGWAFGTAFVWAFLLPGLSGVTFTMTAATCAAASVWRLLSVAWRGPKGSVISSVAASVGWLACAALLRREAAVPALCFWVGALICGWLLDGAPRKQALASLAAVLAALAALEGGWAVASNRLENADYVRWQEARSVACDYGGLAAMDAAALEAAGWTESQRALALDWCFLDESVTAEALSLAASLPHEGGLSDALSLIASLLRRYRVAYWSLAAQAGLCLVTFARALFRRKKRVWNALAPLVCGLLACALLLFLAWRGRLPMRAALSVLLPANALAMWLALRSPAGGLPHARRSSCAEGCGQEPGREKAGMPRPSADERADAAWMRVAAAVLCAALLLPNVRTGVRFTYQPSAGASDSMYTRLERYALAHEDELFIGDSALGCDRALFPDWSAGKPANLLLSWGGWNNHSEGYRAAFARFGYEHDHFRIANFLDAPLRLVTRAGGAPSEALLACMGEQAGCRVEAIAEAQEDGFWIYRFQPSEQPQTPS